MKWQNVFLSCFFSLPIIVSATCDCKQVLQSRDGAESLRLKLFSLVSILVTGGVGVMIPILGRCVPTLSPDKQIFFIVKAFAAGVILATALIHILPDGFANLTSPCLEDDPWRKFPFAGFVTMMSALCTLMIDTMATNYYKTRYFSKAKPVGSGDEEKHEGHVHAHTHAVDGHAHGSIVIPTEDTVDDDPSIRHTIISQASVHALTRSIITQFIILMVMVDIIII